MRPSPGLIVGLALSVVTCACGRDPHIDDADPPPAADQPGLIVASGDITATSAYLWARATTAGPITFTVAADPAFTQPLGEVTLVVQDPLTPVKTFLDGLTPGTQYFYSASDAGGASRAGRFRTLPAAGQVRGLRFGVTGDWRGELSPYPAVSNVAAADLDFLVLLGDTIYADVPSPAVPVRQARAREEFLRKHLEPLAPRLGVETWAEIRGVTPLFATTDDHEVTNDFSGGAPPGSDLRFAGQSGAFINETELFRTGYEAFSAYHPIADAHYGETGDPRTAGKPKLYRARAFGDAAFFLLDARAFRDPPVETGLSALLDPTPFVRAAFAEGRTMLGAVQVEELERDLLAAEQAGTTWKFVLVPEPIQNLGPLAGGDRFEGYADERTRLLRFIDENAIRNVVFVTADIHCTIVNNLTYQRSPEGRQIATSAWEISTGAVAYAAPFGPTTVSIASNLPVFGPLLAGVYRQCDRQGKDELLTLALNALLQRWGYDAIGLGGSSIPHTLLEGAWTSLHTYGWTLFEIDAESRRLTVTTYGIDWYDESDLARDAAGVAGRRPQVVSRFVVQAQ